MNMGERINEWMDGWIAGWIDEMNEWRKTLKDIIYTCWLSYEDAVDYICTNTETQTQTQTHWNAHTRTQLQFYTMNPFVLCNWFVLLNQTQKFIEIVKLFIYLFKRFVLSILNGYLFIFCKCI